MVTLRETARILQSAGCEDAAFDAKILHELAAGDAEKLAALTEKRAARYPLQYLCGEWDFLDFTLKVGEGVLIPRADTEIVCETAIAAARKKSAPVVVDLCAGSGAIAIGIARAVSSAQVTAVELSADALPYLRANVAALAPKIDVQAADIFAWNKTLGAESVDVLVSNPPYITADEMRTLAPELSCEPRMALEAAQNGLAFYEHIAAAYRFAVRKQGSIVFEIGSTQGRAVSEILCRNGWHDVRVLPDYAGLSRVVAACK